VLQPPAINPAIINGNNNQKYEKSVRMQQTHKLISWGNLQWPYTTGVSQDLRFEIGTEVEIAVSGAFN